MKCITLRRVEVRYEVELTGADVAALLRGEHPPLRASSGRILHPPADASVSFAVPGGGDYSGATLDVNRDAPIYITWTETEEEEKEL